MAAPAIVWRNPNTIHRHRVWTHVRREASRSLYLVVESASAKQGEWKGLPNLEVIRGRATAPPEKLPRTSAFRREHESLPRTFFLLTKFLDSAPVLSASRKTLRVKRAGPQGLKPTFWWLLAARLESRALPKPCSKQGFP